MHISQAPSTPGYPSAEAFGCSDESQYWDEITVSAAVWGFDPHEAHQRAREVLKSGQFTSHEDQAQCELLLAYAENLFSDYDTPEIRNTIIEPSLRLLQRLWQFHPPLAIEAAEVAELDTQLAPAVDELTGTQTDIPKLCAAALGHDVGNMMIDPEIIRISEEGKVWTPQHMAAKKPHSFWGRVLAHVAGLPDRGVGRVIYANHAKQTGESYGQDVELDIQERLERDHLADADGGLARMTRNNTRNKGLSLEDRICQMSMDTAWRRGDYWRLSDVNNPDSIRRRVDEVRLGYVLSRYDYHQTDEGLVAVRKAGALSLAAL
jgi:hypothetical protein